MEKTISPTLEKVATYTNCGFRVFLEPDDADLICFISDNLQEYLRFRGYKIIYKTLGIHSNAKRPHIHLNMVCEDRPKKQSNPSMLIKSAYTGKKTPNIILRKKELKYNLLEYINKKGSIGFTERLNCLEYKDWLKYPLKEKQILSDECQIPSNYTLQELVLEAHAEFIVKLKNAEKLNLIKEKKETKMEKFNTLASNYTGENDFHSFYHYILTAYREDPDERLHNLRQLENYSIGYAIKIGILPVDTIVNNCYILRN